MCRSIEARIRIACWLIAGLAVAVLLTVVRTTRDAERANGVIAVATAAVLQQDRSDERLRQVRTAIGTATRAAERARPLHRQLERNVPGGAWPRSAGRLVHAAEKNPVRSRGPRFADAGLTIAIGGYGVAWSSLVWLKRMPAMPWEGRS